MKTGKRSGTRKSGSGCVYLECDSFFHPNQCLLKARKNGEDVVKGDLLEGYPCVRKRGCGFKKRKPPKRVKLSKSDKKRIDSNLKMYGKIQEIENLLKELKSMIYFK